MKGYIYLAGPYSHKSLSVKQARFKALIKKAAELMRSGEVVFSPITHGHIIAEHHTMPTGYGWWQHQDIEMLRHSSKLVILRLDGYADSIGVNGEIKIALSLGIPIEYIDV